MLYLTLNPAPDSYPSLHDIAETSRIRPVAQYPSWQVRCADRLRVNEYRSAATYGAGGPGKQASAG